MVGASASWTLSGLFLHTQLLCFFLLIPAWSQRGSDVVRTGSEGKMAAIKLDVAAFISDYCNGVKDKDLAARHHLSTRELVGIVKKLISNGTISREQYLERNRKIQQLDKRTETDFLKSLYHCAICGHAQPIPFTTCPACGREVAPGRETAAHDDATSEPLAPKPKISISPSPPKQKLHTKLKDFSPVSGVGHELTGADYFITDVIADEETTLVFRAERASGEGPLLSVRLHHADPSVQDSLKQFRDKIVTYQSGMNDPNIVSLVGTATLDKALVLLYEFMPTNLEAMITRTSEGLPLDLLVQLLPQILNGVGYSHMHRGKDGAVRKLPHMLLKASCFLFDDIKNVVKLADCGLWRSRVDVRGHKGHLWEEPAVDLGALAPEAFVLNSRLINGTAADIYALGVVLYRLATGKRPFSAPNPEEYSFLHRKTFAIPPRVHRYTVPGWLDSMIMKCLEKEPTQRWRSATQMELSIGKEIVQ